MKFFTYYTENTPYEEEAKRLLASADKFGIEIVSFPFTTTGNWLKNSSYKYRFMLDMLMRYDEPVVALDADAELLKYPEWLFSIPPEVNVSAHQFMLGDRPDLMDGTLYMTPLASPIVKDVILACETNPRIFDQEHLRTLCMAKYVTVHQMPIEYCYVDFVGERAGVPKENAVIYHHQASRRFKRLTNSGKYGN